MANVLTMGELLWDLFPDGRKLGGAPANVAYHLAQIGHAARVASALGADEPGREARRLLADAGVDTTLVAEVADRPTGTVRVELDPDGVPTFDIVRDVAWDHIPRSDALLAAAGSARVLVFGSLAQRAPESRATLRAALDAAPDALKILDLNFRPPFVAADVVADSLRRADILKLSEDEVAALPELLGLPGGPAFPAALADGFGLTRIYVTRGGDGCEVISAAGPPLRRPTPQVTVADTVGAGDAFTAALVDGELRGLDPGLIAENASATGAYVASQAGAMPEWSEELRARFR